MKIYISHSTGFNYKTELYEPLLKHSRDFELYFPHETSNIAVNTREIIENSDYILAEVSYPSTGQGMELAWAYDAKIPIIYFHKANLTISSSLKLFSNKFFVYQDVKEILEVVKTECPFHKKHTQIQAISHITFICKNLEKTANLLKIIFNAEEIYSSDNKIFSISKEKFLKIGELWVAIMEGEAIHKTYNHIAFKIKEEDLDMFKEKILGLGLEILPSRLREKLEGNSIYFYDYDNHLFELHTGNLETRLKYYENR